MKFPRHNYLGPGENDWNLNPVDSDDTIAYEHDLAYENAKRPSDIRDADLVAIGQFSYDAFHNRNWHSGIGALGLSAKYLFESVTGVVYPSDVHQRGIKTAGKKESKYLHLLRPDLHEAKDEGDSKQSEIPASHPGGSSAPPPVNTNKRKAGSESPETKARSAKTAKFLEFLNTSNESSGSSNTSMDSTIKEDDDDPMQNDDSGAGGNSATGPEVRAVEASCGLTSLGVRLPFETNTSKVATANANAQYPIAHYRGLDTAYFTHTNVNNIELIRKKMVGADIYNLNDSSDKQHDFEQLSAQAASRHFDNPLEICYPVYDRTVDKKGVDACLVHPSEPQIYQFATLINGSNFLGPCFHQSYKPKNGLLFSHDAIQIVGKPAAYTSSNVLVLNNPHKIGLTNPEMFETLKGAQTGVNSILPNWNDSYEDMMLENMQAFSLTHPKTPGIQPRFIIGLLPLRNKDKTLMEAQWEFILDFDLTVACKVGVTGLYARNPSYPEPQYMYPNVRLGNAETRKMPGPPGGDYRGILGQVNLKAATVDKIPVQNRPINADGTPVDLSTEGLTLSDADKKKVYYKT
ncbi:hypothetical protein GE061_020342 [Apolygus lucorum]|uniref:Uncharacterized protein n=1 Tax=Apolygus lucorum TaxID=248454 RepID=A0A8S9WPE9_APOLU|nr:hypothetical protein GE061_020342 [Apolygus lucorum]